ncbi:6830_t:CDS:2, partial [Ambispora gerdemannii]
WTGRQREGWTRTSSGRIRTREGALLTTEQDFWCRGGPFENSIRAWCVRSS